MPHSANNGLSAHTLVNDFRSRWRSGEKQLVEAYLAEHAEVPRDSETLLDLIYSEIELREQSGDAPELAEYLIRFPQFREDLRRLFEVHWAFKETTLSSSKATLGTESTDASAGEIANAGTRFRILRTHAKGGLGEVFVAHDGEVKREVALKRIKAEFADDQESRDRFVREAVITGGLEHPSIVPVYGLGTNENGRPYYAMRLIRGESLQEAIQRFHGLQREDNGTPGALGPNAAPRSSSLRLQNSGRLLELRELLGRFLDVCQAIAYAHSRGVLHRDLKPANVMLGNYGETLVVDWGLAKVVDGSASQLTPDSLGPISPTNVAEGEVTRLGSTIGTPAYMSPEQAAGRIDQLGKASDVYSLGATLYCLLTGQPPQTSRDIGEILARVQRGEFPRPRAVKHDIPRPLEAICLKAMALEPADRYETAEALRDDLNRNLADEAVCAMPESAWQRLQRVGRRNRHWVQAGMVALALVSLVTTLAFFREARIAEEKRQLADENSRLATEERTNSRSLRRSLAKNAFETGLVNYEQGREDQGVRDLQQGWEFALPDDPWREQIRQVLIDRTLRGGRLCLPPLRHDGMVLHVAFSSDGECVATASEDKTVRLWNAHTGAPLGVPMLHEDTVGAVEFSPDGKRLATASVDGTARIWNAQTGSVLGEPMRHEGSVGATVFSPDGNRVVTRSGKIARLWDAHTGALMGEPARHDELITCFTFSTDGDILATSSRDQTARLWNARTGVPLGTVIHHSRSVNAVSISPDGKLLATGSSDYTARLWRLPTGDPWGQPLQHNSSVLKVIFSPDGKSLATTTLANQTVQLWDLATGAKRGEPMFHDGAIQHLAFSPDGERLLTGSSDTTARLWNAHTGVLIGEPLRHDGRIAHVAFSPDGARIATASMDNTARVWNTQAYAPLGEPLIHRFPVLAVAFSPDGGSLVTGGQGRDAQVWHMQTHTRTGNPMPHDDLSWIRSVTVSPDGERIATAGTDKTARLWNAKTGNPLGEPMRHDSEVHLVVFSPDGTRLATASFDKAARAWDAMTGKLLGSPFQHESQVFSLVFSPNGRWLATAGADKTARLWDVRTGAPHASPLQHKGSVISVVFSPGSERIATASADKTARLWNSHSGAGLGEPMRHNDGVSQVRFSPDGERLATVSADNTVRIWNAHSGIAQCESMRHKGPIRSIAFCPVSERLATGSADKSVRLWDTRTGVSLGEPMLHEAEVSAVSFSPNGEQLATASGNNIKFWLVPPPPAPQDLSGWIALWTGCQSTDSGKQTSLHSDDWRRRLLLHQQVDAAYWQRSASAVTQQLQEHHQAKFLLAIEQSDWMRAKFHARHIPRAASRVRELVDSSQLSEKNNDWGLILLLWGLGEQEPAFSSAKKIAETTLLGCQFEYGSKRALEKIRKSLPESVWTADADALALWKALNQDLADSKEVPPLPAPTLANWELSYVDARGKLIAQRFDGQAFQRTKLPEGKVVRLQWLKAGTELYAAIDDKIWRLPSDNSQLSAAPHEVGRLPSTPHYWDASDDGQRWAWGREIPGRVPELLVQEGPTGSTTSLLNQYDPTWLPDGKRLAYLAWKSGSWNLAFWDGEQTKTASAPFHSTLAGNPTSSPNGEFLAFAMKAADGTRQIGLISLDGKQIRQLTANGTLNTLPAFSPDGRYVAYVQDNEGKSHDLRVVDVETEEDFKIAEGVPLLRPTWRRAAARVSGASFLPWVGHHSDAVGSVVPITDERLLTVSNDGTLASWSLPENSRVDLVANGGIIHAAAKNPKQRWIATGNSSGAVAIIDLETKELVRSWKVVGNVWSLAWHPEGELLVTAAVPERTTSSIWQLWNVTTGKELWSTIDVRYPWIGGVSFSPDGKWVVGPGKDAATGITVRNVTDGSEVFSQSLGDKPAWGGCISPDGRWLAAAELDGNHIVVWQLPDRKLHAKLKSTHWTFCPVFSPDSRFIAAGNIGSDVLLWDVESGGELECFKGHSSGVAHVAFSPSGKSLVSGSWDETVRVWQVPQPKTVETGSK